MIVEEKTMQGPPPPYQPRPHPNRNLTTFDVLPSHILLQIVYYSTTCSSLQLHRKSLYWLSTSLRLVNRALYIASMHILRSTYLPSYHSLIRSPYSSDPFPLILSQSISPYRIHTHIQTIQRETTTLDLFIALKVREDVWADDSELHLERDESFKDLFDLIQPRSRLEDLVRIYGLRDGLITLDSTTSTPITLPSPPPPLPPSPSSSSTLSSVLSAFSSKSKSRSTPTPYTLPPSPRPSPGISPLPFPLVSIAFSPRTVAIVLLPTKRTIVQTKRNRDESLEKVAKRLVGELKVWLSDGGS